jgi:indolepyruvate ferredoxin oxidoreductase beta subunit
MAKTTNIILLGVGGQGMLTLMEMLAMAAEKAGEEVRVLSRVSLARLGGSGMCHIRIGPSASAAIPAGEVDILLTLEMSEVLRAVSMARRGALAFVNTYRRLPIATGVAGLHYPTRSEVEEALRSHGITGVFVPESISGLVGDGAEQEQDDTRINIVMLGVLCAYTRLLPRSTLEEAITERLPHFAEQNLRTFALGWSYGEAQMNCGICFEPEG